MDTCQSVYTDWSVECPPQVLEVKLRVGVTAFGFGA